MAARLCSALGRQPVHLPYDCSSNGASLCILSRAHKLKPCSLHVTMHLDVSVLQVT